MTGIAAYEIARVVADENLRHGISVIVDAVNPVEAARERWRSLAREHGVALRIVECICSDARIHRRRIEQRARNIPGMAEIPWERVEERRREYEPWVDGRLVVDTAQDIEDVADLAISYVTSG